MGTSATLQSDDAGPDPREGTARFFSRLTGQDTGADAVITESVETPATPPEGPLPPIPSLDAAALRAFDPDNPAAALDLARRLAGVDGNDARSLDDLWSGFRLPYRLMQWLRGPLPVLDIVELLRAEPGLEQATDAQLRAEIEAALMLGFCLPEDHPLLLRPRVHRFLRGLARFWRCVNPDCGCLAHESVEFCTACGARKLPLAICRTCGLANPARGANQCARCGAELSGSAQTAWDAGAFQSWPSDVEPETEEERASHSQDVGIHPRMRRAAADRAATPRGRAPPGGCA